MKAKFILHGTVIRIIDGDSLFIAQICPSYLDTDVVITKEIRLAHINAAELNTPAGQQAWGFIKNLVPTGASVEVHTYGWEKYHRVLADVYLLGDTMSISDRMLQAGQAVSMEAKKQLLPE